MNIKEFYPDDATSEPDDTYYDYNNINMDMLHQEWADEDRLDPSKFIQRGTNILFPNEFYFDEEEK